MNSIEKYLEAIEYKIFAGAEHHWTCYGPNAWYCDGFYGSSAIFDRATKEIYEVVLDGYNDITYRWIHPDYRKAHDLEYAEKQEELAFEDAKYADTDCFDDIIQKITVGVDSSEFDPRVVLNIDFTEEELSVIEKASDLQGITKEEFLSKTIENLVAESLEKD